MPCLSSRPPDCQIHQPLILPKRIPLAGIFDEMEPTNGKFEDASRGVFENLGFFQQDEIFR